MTERHSASIITKRTTPILTYRDIPYNAALVFNAGVTKYEGKYVMAFRNDYGSYEEQRLDGTNIGIAFSDDGIHWQVRNKPWFAMKDEEIVRAYDPRLSVVDGQVYMCMAVDTRHGLRGCIARTDDFENLEILTMTVPDNRNMVLFPERINGNFVRLERPMPNYSRGNKDRFDIWLSESPDMKFWGESRLVMGVEQVPFANNKIGPGAPPVKTSKGYLTLFHAVERDPERGKNGWENRWQKIYYAGIALLDLEDPSRVIGMYREPLIASELPFEKDEGYRTDVIFPGGMILEDSGEVKIYYGAADAVECLATADVDDLLKLCLEGEKA